MSIYDKYLPEFVMIMGATYTVLGIFAGGKLESFAPLGVIIIGFAIYIRYDVGYGDD